MLRAATDADVDSIRSWRNQTANRDVSVHSHPISPEEHADWWRRTGADPTRRVMMYERAGRACGVVNFFDLDLDSEPSTGAWGFFLDSGGLEKTGETLPAWIEVMREATAYAFDTLGLARLDGEVLEHNTAVRQMNGRFHFTEGEPDTRFVDGREITVYPISLRREDRRTPRGSS